MTAWFYGGSTAFGLGQRDDQTIPSVLARAAWEDGIVLDVQNRGVEGDTHWEAAQRFAWDVSDEDPPDLVVFYDGTNEILASSFGLASSSAPALIPSELWDEYADRAFEPAPAPPGATKPPGEPAPRTASAVGTAIAQRYERSRVLSRLTAESESVTPVWVWQPASERRPPRAAEADAKGRRWALERLAAARKELGDDVIDLSTVLDEEPGAVFYDQLHTNERGAEIIGRALYSRVRSQIQDLTAGGAR